MNKTENTHKMTIRLSPVTEFRLERDYRLDGSRSKNEFIEKAITHYQDILEAEQNETLPVAIQSAIDADYLRKLRANSVKSVKATNGLLTFEQKAREQLDDGAGDDQWPD